MWNVLLEMSSKRKKRKGGILKDFESCKRQVSKQKGVKSAAAICVASLQKKHGKKKVTNTLVRARRRK